MTDRLLERQLRELEAPGEGDAALRAWELAAAEYERLELVPRRRRPVRRAVVLAAAALCLVALAISPAGASVAHWVGDRFSSPGVKHARPALVSLPAPGRLLVTSRDGVWIVQHDGSERRLGPYRDAAWSPHGLFVAVVRGHNLLAVDPRGRVRWSLPRVPRPERPSWSPGDGFRVAYLSGSALRVVNGDGTGDRLLAGPVAPVRPAWRPGLAHVLGYVTARGRIAARNVDTRRVLWRTRGLDNPVSALEWSADGARLIAWSARALSVLDGRSGRVIKSLVPASNSHLLDAQLSPRGRTIALARYDERAGRSELLLLTVRARGWHARRVFEGAGRFDAVRWSPDGRWLLVSWRDADQWVFLRSASVRGLVAVRNIGRTFEPDRVGGASFPRVGAWCCPP